MPIVREPPLAALALVSAGALCYEILLMRLFSIIQWHHFAYMSISLAMLGYGVSGTLLTLLRGRLLPRFREIFAGCAALFGVSAVGVFLLAQQLPFNPLEILWDIRQPAWLLLLYLLLSVPFLFAASGICLLLARYGAQVHRVYSYDLLGAAMGCLLAILLLYWLPPMEVLRAVGVLGLAAAMLAVWHYRLRPRWVLPLLLLATLLLVAALPPSWLQLRFSPYKNLSQTLLIPGMHVVEERSSPLGLISVVESTRVPFRHAPGLSLNAMQGPPSQLGVFVDGDAFLALTRFSGELEPLAYLDLTTSALPYHLVRQPKVLVLGAGTGTDVLQAVLHHARHVDAVELDSGMVALVADRFADYGGNLYRRPEVQVHAAEARSFVEASRERYDIIQVALLDTFGAAAAGLYGLSESYLYTVEGLQSYLRHLKPGGMLSMTRWITIPPRDLVKLAATAILALELEGVANPGYQLALIRGWQTGTLLVKNGPFTVSELAEIRDFAAARSFDVEWLPGLAREESNRYNLLDQPYFYDSIVALTGPARQDFMARYKFDITPATDDHPYFYHFFRWTSLPEIFHLKGRGGLPLLEMSYPILLATLLQAILAALVLILLPLWFGLRGKSEIRAASGKPATLAYFTLIGFAFIFLEMTFIQKFTLFLGHPLYAVAVVLCAFLLFASLGSRLAPRLLASKPAGRAPMLIWPITGITLAVLANLFVTPLLVKIGMSLPEFARIVVAAMLIAPLAFCMGMPFPLGMARLDAAAPALVPWAWGVNACATVVGAALATLLALHVGYTRVALLAIVLYLVAAAIFSGMGQRRPHA
jgi:SAM-dependent methyltransferase